MNEFQIILGNIIITIGVIFMMFGALGVFRFKTFYTRLLAVAKTDTVGALTIIIGLIVRQGFTFFSGKLALLAIIMLMFNPLVSHILARSAYLSGYHEDEDETSDNAKIPVKEGEK
ncbi:MAG: monovalent cation/H(+) antiporter subunit G [Defluviitaleaceae bacterium]|nr:monovalent cation/H(+) antiporter subunit G [Defluviitaleaceae bacterium]